MPILFSTNSYSFYMFLHNSKESNVFPNFSRYIQSYIYVHGFLSKLNLQLLTVLENRPLTIDMIESTEQSSFTDSWFLTYRLKEQIWQGSISSSASILKLTTFQNRQKESRQQMKSYLRNGGTWGESQQHFNNIQNFLQSRVFISLFQKRDNLLSQSHEMLDHASHDRRICILEKEKKDVDSNLTTMAECLNDNRSVQSTL